MTRERTRYFSFLLRLWLAGTDGKPIWRASLESPLTGEHLGFASLKELFAFLEAQIGETVLPGEADPGES
jgi:hypothetical protein